MTDSSIHQPTDQPPLFDDATPSLRLFVGLMPDADVQRALHSHRARWRWPVRAWLPAPERFHMTLDFLGEVHADRLPALQAALASVAMPKMRLVLRRPEMWGVAVLRVEENAALRELHDRVVLQLWRLGFAARAEWTPHITLARKAGAAVAPSNAPPVCWSPEAFSLIWSRLGPVTQYRELGRYPVVAS